jgi:OOP family OmpA-OmpF porin
MAESRGSRTAVDDSFAELRTLLVGPEQRELLELQARLHDSAAVTRDVARVLPDAIALRTKDPALNRVLAPLVEESITASVRKDPQPLADALFPVMGPAIRRAIAHTLSAMMETFSRSLEDTVSWRAMQWRWTAWRTGRPYSEIVLLHSLQYRVEEVFLIHAETGLLLQHVSRAEATGKDPDQISGMLTAIQDFVRDSFSVGGADSLEALRVGELAVFIERGPEAVVAGVVRGTAPPAIRRLFEDAVEAVHRRFGPELEAFSGDAGGLDASRPILEACLVTELREPQRRRSYRPWLAAAAVAALAAAVWFVSSALERRRWNAYVERLAAEPGIVVVSSGRQGGRFFVSGLRDPLAADPLALAAPFRVRPERIASRWEPYQAIQASFVASRAVDLLKPPRTVTLAFRDGVLTANGDAPARWVTESERLAPALAGVRRFAYLGRDPEIVLADRLRELSPLFVKGTSSLAQVDGDVIGAVRNALAELNETARARGKRIRVEVRGHTDSDGSDVLNAPLGGSRARALLNAIDATRFEALLFSTSSVGSAEPLTAGATEEDKQRNRRVSIHVLPQAGESAAPPGR